MARIVRRSDNEPLKTLERPNSASSQTTAHIINSCFKEILTQTPLDPGAVNNLAVSRRGESIYHDEFVDGLKKISNEYNQRLNKLAHLEHHVIQARAKALAEDEKVLSGLAKVCSSFQEIGLPKGPSTLHQLLDDELLSEYHLLAPSQYLPQLPSQSQPPTEGPPSYMQPTHTSSLHATVKSKIQHSAAITAKHPTKLAWKNTLTPAERQADKIALSKLEHRSLYLQNPKYSNTALTNTASSGPLKLKQVQQGVDYTQGGQFFIAEPSGVLFSDYQPGNTYEACVKLKNISGASRQLRIVPLSSSYFTVTPDQFPNTDGLIAPGMYCSYTVTFNPDSLANYEDELKVLTNNGVCLGVPIQAIRPAPELTLPRVLEVGCCLAGDSMSSTIECSNLGGEGAFRLMSNNDSEQKRESTDTLSVGPFSISPSEFHLSAGSSMSFMVQFKPSGVGKYSEDFIMACDNGQVLSFTLKGIAGKVDIGCIFTGETSRGKVATLTSDSVHFLLDEDDPVISNTNESSHDPPSVIECPCVEFSPVNPHTTAHSTVIIKNFSKMDLPFTWSFYRPITRPLQTSEASSGNEDVPLINQLVPSKHNVFSVQPSSGVLSAGEAKSFSFRFHPAKIGSFIDMAHLVLSGIHTDLGLDPTLEGVRWLRLSEANVSVVYVETSGTSQDYSVEMSPPAVLFASELPIASETKKRIKMSNHSLSDVTYHWDGYEGEGASISMEPAYGSIATGSSVVCELVVQAHSMGPFNTKLLCHLELCDATFTLPVEGCVEVPIVKPSVPNLNYGLIQLGRSSTLSFTITNFSNCSVNCHFRQIAVNEQTDHCLSITNGTEDSFILHAYGSTTVNVECHPKRVGQICSVLEMLVNEIPYKNIAVLVEVQQPQVHLEKCELHIERAYVGIDSKHTVTLRNSGLISTQFTWSSQVYGVDSEHCTVKISPMTDRIGPRDAVTITIGTTWNKIGSHSEAVLRCDVLGADKPLFLSLSAEVFGLSVSYHVQKQKSSDSLSEEDCSSEILSLDYGTNALGTPVDLKVTVRNNSAIPTSLEAYVTNFPAAKPPTPPSHPNTGPGEPILQKRGKYLLQRTVNIGDPKSKSTQQAAIDYANSLLRDGCGACFLVTPSSTELPPFSTVTLTVTAYSNMWGEYTDQLICKVADGDRLVIPIRYSATGCPVIFQITGTPAQTLLRFGSHLPNSKVIKRVLKMKNTSPVDLRIDWAVANIICDDSKIIDLVTFFDVPFPKLDTFMSSKLASTTPTHGTTNRGEEEALCEVSSNEESLGQSSCHLINVLIKPHEGVSSDHPFGITPKQMVIPAHGQCSVTLSFQPSIRALNEVGDTLASYALGHFSLDDQDPPNVTRTSGYDVEPLRVDMLASIEHAKLTLDCDEDDGLNFNLPASELLNRDQRVLESVNVSHGFTLINSSSSLLQFNCSTSTQHFRITNVTTVYECKENITLKPQQNVTFSVIFTLTLDYLIEKTRDVPPSDKTITFEDVLQIEFTTGAMQVFPLKAIIVLPKLDISKNAIDFNKCLLGAPVSTNVTLSNTTGSSVPWTATISPELKEVMFVDCEDGLLPPYLTDGKPSSQLMQVTFIPSHEASYLGLITLQEQLTGKQLTINITGYGSPDEQYYPQLNQ